jgi:hypothetical protein
MSNPATDPRVRCVPSTFAMMMTASGCLTDTAVAVAEEVDT